MSKTTNTYLNVSLNDIVPNPVKLREVDTECTEFLELVDSISVSGVRNAPTVRIVQDAELGEIIQLVDGLHRVTAAKQAGLETIDVNVIVLNDVEVLIEQISANYHSIATKPADAMKALKAILAAESFLTLGELGKRLGKSTEWVKGRLSLDRIKNEKTLVLINEGKITLANAYSLATLPEEDQEDVTWLTQAQTDTTGEFLSKVESRLREVRAAARQARKETPLGFVANIVARKVGAMKEAIEDTALIAKLATGAETVEEGIQLGMKYALSSDPESVRLQEEAYNNKKAAAEEARKEKAAKRDKAAAERSAEASEKLSEDADEALG